MKKLMKITACLFLIVAAISCSGDDDSKSSTNNPSSDVSFDGDGLEFVDVSLDAYPNSKTEAIFTTINNVSVIIYFKKDDDGYQDIEDGTVTYDADGVVYNEEAEYPDNTVRGYINSADGQYQIMSGTIKVKLNGDGNHEFTFDTVIAENVDTAEEAALDGETTITEAN